MTQQEHAKISDRLGLLHRQVSQGFMADALDTINNLKGYVDGATQDAPEVGPFKAPYVEKSEGQATGKSPIEPPEGFDDMFHNAYSATKIGDYEEAERCLEVCVEMSRSMDLSDKPMARMYVEAYVNYPDINVFDAFRRGYQYEASKDRWSYNSMPLERSALPPMKR